jgi:hypothetical protein
VWTVFVVVAVLTVIENYNPNAAEFHDPLLVGKV